jgi:hypothetical protein
MSDKRLPRPEGEILWGQEPPIERYERLEEALRRIAEMAEAYSVSGSIFADATAAFGQIAREALK